MVLKNFAYYPGLLKMVYLNNLGYMFVFVQLERYRRRT